MEQIELPKFHETFNPILDILSDGKIIHHRELLKKVIEKYYSKLPKELLEEKTKTGDLLILNRIAWGKSYLKKGGFIFYPERAMVQITDKGKASKGGQLSIKDVEGDSEFMDFYKEEKAKGISTNIQIHNSTPQDLIDTGFSEIEAQIKTELLERLKNIDPYYFEKGNIDFVKENGIR